VTASYELHLFVCHVSLYNSAAMFGNLIVSKNPIIDLYVFFCEILVVLVFIMGNWSSSVMSQ